MGGPNGKSWRSQRRALRRRMPASSAPRPWRGAQPANDKKPHCYIVIASKSSWPYYNCVQVNAKRMAQQLSTSNLQRNMQTNMQTNTKPSNLQQADCLQLLRQIADVLDVLRRLLRDLVGRPLPILRSRTENNAHLENFPRQGGPRIIVILVIILSSLHNHIVIGIIALLVPPLCPVASPTSADGRVRSRRARSPGTPACDNRL